MSRKPKLCVVLAALLASTRVHAAEPPTLEDVVVTAPRSDEPLVVRTNPKAPRQPIPAHDGAEYLKTIPGFSVVRKGGTDGDPVFRGMAGSRLGILLDGQQIYGGCGGRMDPPTAYVFPAAYDRITVLKGPETVLYGSGNSAGAVLFERLTNHRGLSKEVSSGITANGALTLASFGRHDEVAAARLANASAYVQLDGTRTQAGDYKDGNGLKYNSRYMRWSGNAALGFTPDDDTLLELSLARSNGYAAYADRSMDGSLFARNNHAVKFSKSNLSPLVKKLDAQWYYNYIDHVMDNYSLRPVPAGSTYSVMNPDRRTTGGRVAATLSFSELTEATVGLDTTHDVHGAGHIAMGKASAAIANMYGTDPTRYTDMEFSRYGIFGEVTRYLSQDNKVVGGLRFDQHKVVDGRKCIATWACKNLLPVPTLGQNNDTRYMSRTATLASGFARYESGILNGAGIYYAGFGHAERFPDYWELVSDAIPVGSPRAGFSDFFNLRPEKTNQIDVGMNWKTGAWSGSVSGFYGKVTDYILKRWTAAPGFPVDVRNINATTMGAEADVSYRVTNSWKLDGTLAYVRADNSTDNKPLAQQPPLEIRLGANYDDKVYSFGILSRLVDAQTRFDDGAGNIVMNGMDRGRTGGFGVLSLNAGWRPSRVVQLTAGVDNLLGKVYTENLNGAGAAAPGYLNPLNVRLNEPGRNLWVKANITFD